METLGRHHGNLHRDAPLKPSLVEWKPGLSRGAEPEIDDLETFLGGMETLYVVLCIHVKTYLETFLGGMETFLLAFLGYGENLP